MKDTAPKGLGIIAVAAVFGIIAAGIALVLFDFGAFGAIFIGLIIAAITAVVLMLGWREPAPAVTHAAPPQAAPVSARTPSAEPAPAPAPEPVSAPAAEAATPAAAPVAAKDAAVKPSAALAGETELASKKGEWKYEAPAAEPKPKAKPKAKPAAKKSADAAAPAGDAVKPEFLSAARDGGPDDLKQIKGVGPKLEKMLHGMGIFHFDQIAAWGPSEQKWVDENLEGFKGRATRDTWVDQSKVLAAGGETEFSKKVEKGGVY